MAEDEESKARECYLAITLSWNEYLLIPNEYIPEVTKAISNSMICKNKVIKPITDDDLTIKFMSNQQIKETNLENIIKG